MTCDCEVKINKLLKPKGESLDVLHEVGGKNRSWLMVRVSKGLDSRGKCTNVVCNYCPFCGKNQEKT